MSVLLEVKDLTKKFPIKKSLFSKFGKSAKAVDRVSYTLNKGETLGIVGESGCGKTALGRTTIKLYDPTSGSILFNGTDITNLDQEEMLDLRKEMQMIFKDPYQSLNPRMKVSQVVGEAIDTHYAYKGYEKKDEIENVLLMAGLEENYKDKYPHELSAVQRQKIGIARALAVDPSFIVCDDPASALDISVQAQIINMLGELQHELDLTYLFIASDLSMIKYIATHVGIMYLGRILEKAPTEEIYSNPQHPYTQALLSAMPTADLMSAKNSNRIILRGDTPSLINQFVGCKFKDRCSMKKPICSEQEPDLRLIGREHYVACFMIK